MGWPDTPTARPSIPLPAIEGVTLLGTVGEVFDESRRMKHCIASYAADAVAGRSYLFHIDYCAGEV